MFNFEVSSFSSDPWVGIRAKALAEALFANGDKSAAIETERKALALIKTDSAADKKLRAAVEASLERFQKGKEKDDR